MVFIVLPLLANLRYLDEGSHTKAAAAAVGSRGSISVGLVALNPYPDKVLAERQAAKQDILRLLKDATPRD
jgi:hypothetical protein